MTPARRPPVARTAMTSREQHLGRVDVRALGARPERRAEVPSASIRDALRAFDAEVFPIGGARSGEPCWRDIGAGVASPRPTRGLLAHRATGPTMGSSRPVSRQWRSAPASRQSHRGCQNAASLSTSKATKRVYKHTTYNLSPRRRRERGQKRQTSTAAWARRGTLDDARETSRPRRAERRSWYVHESEPSLARTNAV